MDIQNQMGPHAANDVAPEGIVASHVGRGSSMDLDGKVVLVTGASRGIGRSVALECARYGADVVINYASGEDAADAVAEEVRALGRRALVVGAKVEDYDSVDAMVKKTVEEFGRVDVFVNNAGILRRSFLMMMKSEDFVDTMMVNLVGAFHGIKAVSRHMIKERSGTIINVSSTAGFRGFPGQGAYSASKGGLHSLTVVAANELARYGIRVNAVAPAVIDVGMMKDFKAQTKESYIDRIPLGRAGEPEEVARSVIFLASEAGSYITGQVLTIDGGMFIRP